MTRAPEARSAHGVHLTLFATAREAVGRSELEVAVPSSGKLLRDLLAELARQYPRLGPILPACRVARNGEYVAGGSTRLWPGDELALHPPYSGG